MSLARFSFRNAQGVILVALFLSLLGGVAYRRMGASILPDFPFPRIVIIVSAGDMAIQDVVVRLTRPLESAADSVPGAKRIVSKSARGAAEISADFEWGTNLFEAFTRLNAAIAQIRSSLPQESSIEVEWVNPSSFPILGYSMTSAKRRPAELREIATLTVAPFLGRLNGIYRVLVQGGEVREYEVLLDPSALAAAAITPEQVPRPSPAPTCCNLWGAYRPTIRATSSSPPPRSWRCRRSSMWSWRRRPVRPYGCATLRGCRRATRRSRRSPPPTGAKRSWSTCSNSRARAPRRCRAKCAAPWASCSAAAPCPTTSCSARSTTKPSCCTIP